MHLSPDEVTKIEEGAKQIIELSQADDDEVYWKYFVQLNWCFIFFQKWVKVASGLANRWIVAPNKVENVSARIFLKDRLDNIVSSLKAAGLWNWNLLFSNCVLLVETDVQEDKAAVVMFLPMEYQYLSKRLQPPLASNSKNPHFSVHSTTGTLDNIRTWWPLLFGL